MLENGSGTIAGSRGLFAEGRNPETAVEFGRVLCFRYGKTTISQRLLFQTFGRLQKESAEELACTGEGVFALVAVPEDILLQLAEELRVLLLVRALLA